LQWFKSTQHKTFERRGEFTKAQDYSATMQILKQKEDTMASGKPQKRHITGYEGKMAD